MFIEYQQLPLYILILFIHIIIATMTICVIISYDDDEYLKNAKNNNYILDDEYDISTSIANDLTSFLKKNNIIKNDVDDSNCTDIIDKYYKIQLPTHKKKLSTSITIELEDLLKNKVDLATFKLIISKINKYLSE